ncbi:MAG: hypothetical protein E7253_00810 [Lachnospiraceae bacterium]|nr:hypothetical protein [Lachnospiraceae bacterium]
MDDQKYQFDDQSFFRYYEGFRKKEKMKKGALDEYLGDQIRVSSETVKGWRCKKYGPSELEMIKRIGEVFRMKDWKVLLKLVDEKEDTMGLTSQQKESLKRVYDVIMDFLFEFERTDGFNDYWISYSLSGEKDIEDKIILLVDDKIAGIDLVLNKEYFYLGEHDVFDELAEYVGDTINSIVDGKLSYAYRYEAISNGNPTTMEDYDMAMRTILTIIDKYK